MLLLIVAGTKPYATSYVPAVTKLFGNVIIGICLFIVIRGDDKEVAL